MVDNGGSPISNVNNVAVESKNSKTAGPYSKKNAAPIKHHEVGITVGKQPVTMSERKELQESLKQTLTEFKES